MNTIALVGISGSLRLASSNTMLLRSLQAAMPKRASLELLPLQQIPPYNQDLDGANPPASVKAFKAAIEHSDGIVISSPEYNHGTSGVLKNALDWASRPANASPLKGKPVLLMTCSPAFTGGVRAHAQLRETLSGALARVLARPQVVVASAHAKIQDGRFIDEAVLKFALEAIADLIDEVNLLRTARCHAMG
jgi:chromate reductase